jgi:hypothetical protein
MAISFLARPGLQALPTPYIIESSRTAAFAVPTGDGAIQRLLDATLNAAATPPGHALVRRFEPLLEALVLAFIHYPDVHAEQSGTPAANRWGRFSYQECAVFLALRDTQGEGLGTCWHVPMLVLNQCIPLLLGREVYGMPKVFGRVDARALQLDDWRDHPTGVLKVSTEGFAQLGAASALAPVEAAEATLHPRHLGLPFGFRLAEFDPLDLVRFAADVLPSTLHLRPLLEFFERLVGFGLPGIFLKQFPDGSGTGGAVYQRLLKAAFTPTAISSPTFRIADVKLFDPASYPLASTFGITPGAVTRAVGLFAEFSWVLPPPADL